MIERINYRSLVQKTLRVLAWPKNRIDKTQLHFAGLEAFANYLNVFDMTPGVLNFAPTEFDLAANPGEKRLLPLSFGRFRNIFRDEILGVVEQHAVWLAVCFQNLSAEWIGRVIVNLRDF